MISNRLATLFATLLFLTFSGSAFSYIDGGTGSMLLQAGISGVLGALFLARGYIASIATKLRRRQNEPSPAHGPTAE